MLAKNAVLTGLKAGPDDDLDEGVFTAYASVFNNVDAYGDVVVKGAFDNDLKRWEASGNPIPLLFGHRMDDPDYNIGHVESASEDDKGLLIRGRLDLEGGKGRQVYRLLKGRRVTQMSFAYDVVDAAYETRDGEDVFMLKELALHEVSVVPVGANPATEILGVKSWERLAERAEYDLKNGRTIPEDGLEMLRAAHSAMGKVLSGVESATHGEASGAPGDTSVRPDQGPADAGDGPSVPVSLIDAMEAELSLYDTTED